MEFVFNRDENDDGVFGADDNRMSNNPDLLQELVDEPITYGIRVHRPDQTCKYLLVHQVSAICTGTEPSD